jgi:hypothetical protein
MMDSPRLQEEPAQEGLISSIYNWLAQTERGLYRHIPPPDVVLRLTVSFETAKQRNAARDILDDEVYRKAAISRQRNGSCRELAPFRILTPIFRWRRPFVRSNKPYGRLCEVL